MNGICPFCGAMFFAAETTGKGVYTTCCKSGAIWFNFIQCPDPYIVELFTGSSPDAKLFQKTLRKFNTALAFASCLFKEEIFDSIGPPVVVVRGNILHKLGSAYKDPNKKAAFMQCYFYDGNEKENNCFTFSPAEVGIVNYMSSIIKLNVDNMH
jgi:hypothetical protein